jgi:hypothetical protein
MPFSWKGVELDLIIYHEWSDGEESADEKKSTDDEERTDDEKRSDDEDSADDEESADDDASSSDEDLPGEGSFNGNDEEAGDTLEEDIGSDANDQIEQGGAYRTPRKFADTPRLAPTQSLSLPEDDLKDRTMVVIWLYNEGLMASTSRFPTA